MCKKEVWFECNEVTPDGQIVFTAKSIQIHSIRQARNILAEIYEDRLRPNGKLEPRWFSPRLKQIRQHELQHFAEVITNKGQHVFGGLFYMGKTKENNQVVAYCLPSEIPHEAAFRSYIAPGRSGLINLSQQDIQQAFTSYLMMRQSFNGGNPKLK